MKIGIASDHAGYELKEEILKIMKEEGYDMVDYGTKSPDRVNYPDFGRKLGEGVASKEVDCGIAICGTGIGISIAANKVHGVRAAVCSEPVSAKLSKEHNDANIIAFGARIVGIEMAKAIVEAWLNAKFQGGRHVDRVSLLDNM
ncbi:MAG TPA: ribose 5-phosphate isomerase B [Candidatus Dorea intestinavium]|nr:ribose 5-phosphate isomerase B [Candidatus Dorea intestinavium]